MPSFAQYHVNEVARAAKAAHVRMMRGDLATLYVYFKPMQIEAFADIRPLVVGATNPCPCGWYGAQVIRARECSCTPEMIERYTRRVTEFMLQLGMDTCTAGIELAELTIAAYRDASVPRAEPSELVRERIAATRRGFAHLGIES